MHPHMLIEKTFGGDFLFSTLLTIRLLEMIYGITIPVLLYVDDYKVLYALGNISGPSETPGTPTPGESFVTVYFRVNNFTGSSIELELLLPCFDRTIDPSLIGADGIPVNEILKDGELYVTRTGQIITVNVSDIVAIQKINSNAIVPFCPTP